MAKLILNGATSGSISLESPAVSGTTTLTLPTTTGTVLTTNGSGIASVNGIQFPATQSASADANTLDDYEEGTWTPTVASMTVAGGTAAYTGRYIKIGKVVYCTMLSTTTATVTYATVAGTTNFTLPFPALIINSAIQNYVGSAGNGNTNAGGTVGIETSNSTCYFFTTISATIGIIATITYITTA